MNYAGDLMSDDIKKLSEELDSITDEEIYKVYTTDAMKMYLQSISIYPSLTIEEQKELFIKGEKDKLVKCMLKLVVRVAYQYRYRIRNLEVLDIIQEGNMGLLKALDKYNPSLGAFTTYAIPWIRESIKRSIQLKDKNMHKAIYMQDLIKKYFLLVEKSNSEGRTLTKEEIIKSLKIDDKKYHALINAISQNVISINQKVDDDSDTELEDFIPDENANIDNLIDEISLQNLKIVLKNILKPLEYYIIYNRFFSNPCKSLEEIGRSLNITRERVRQKQEKILIKIKPYLKENSIEYKRIFKSLTPEQIKKYKTTPIEPLDIIKYLYLKSELKEEEEYIYKLELLGNYYYTDNDYEKMLQIDQNKIKEIKKSLSVKINQVFQDKRLFNSFVSKTIKTYGTKIYLNITEGEVNYINYGELKDKYASLDFETIISYFKEVNYDLNPSELKLLTNYFAMPKIRLLSNTYLEQAVNIVKFGFKNKEKHLPFNELYKTFLENKDEFSIDEQNFISMYIFNKNMQKDILQNNPYYYNKKSRRNKKYSFINILERMYYHIYGYNKNIINKKIYLDLKKKYPQFLSFDNEQIMDLYFGVDGQSYTPKEIASLLNIPYNKLHGLIFDIIALLNSLYIKKSLSINKNIYIPYIINDYYEFTNETRNILKLFIIDNLSYEKIAQITNLDNRKVSNIITDGIRKCDY